MVSPAISRTGRPVGSTETASSRSLTAPSRLSLEVEKSLKNLKRGRMEDDWMQEELPQKSARGEESPAQNLPKEAGLP